MSQDHELKVRVYFLFVMCGALMGLSCQPPSLAVNAAIGISSALTFAILMQTNPLTKKAGLCFGLALTAVQFHWVGSVFGNFTGSGLLSSACFAVTVFLLASLQFVFLAWIYTYLKKFQFVPPTLCLPVAWTVAELTFPKFIPWYHGSTLIALGPLIQIADIGGPPLVSFMLFWCCSIVAWLVMEIRQKGARSFSGLQISYGLLALGLVLGVLIYGKTRESSIAIAEANAPVLNVLVVQPNLNPQIDFSVERLSARSARLGELTRAGLQTSAIRPDLIIWPESAVGETYYTDEAQLGHDDSRWPFKGSMVPLLFGGQVQIGDVYSAESQFYNAAMLLLPNGGMLRPYYKEMLFPFSEQIPLATRLPSLKNIFKPISNYKAGADENTKAIYLGSTAIAVRICFEDIWPELFRQNVSRDQAQLLVSLSNDGWFAETAAGHQHHLLALWRAVENRRYLVRAGNNGITEVISASGRIIESIPVSQPTYSGVIPVKLLNEQTVFSRFGFISTWGVLVLIVGGAAILKTILLLLRKTNES